MVVPTQEQEIYRGGGKGREKSLGGKLKVTWFVYMDVGGMLLLL